MSVIINPIITNAGLNVFTPMATGIEFTFTHVAVGTGTSAVNANATALENEIDRFTIAGGGVIAGGKAVSINALVTNHSNANPQDYNISEIGFYGLDGNNNTILFAIHRQSTTIVRKVAGADIAMPFVLGLSALPVENMTVTIDTNTSGALALLGQHVANAHPHTQYKRTNDASERLKVAAAVESDEAIRKEVIDALQNRLLANGIDADLATTNHLPNINVDSYLIPEGYFDDSTLGDKPFANGLCKTWKENVGVIYQFAQSYTNGDIATRLWRDTLGYWTSWKYYANISGSSTQTFSVAAATANDHAVRKEQLDALSNAAITNEQIVKLVYPVGSLIEFQDGTDPNTLWPYTTWAVYGEGRVTVAQKAGDFPYLTAVGGGKEFTLTMAHIPEHDHDRNTDGEAEDIHISAGNGAAGDYSGTNGYIHVYTKTGKAGQATPTPVPTMPPYIVVKRWVRTV